MVFCIVSVCVCVWVTSIWQSARIDRELWLPGVLRRRHTRPNVVTLSSERETCAAIFVLAPRLKRFNDNNAFLMLRRRVDSDRRLSAVLSNIASAPAGKL